MSEGHPSGINADSRDELLRACAYVRGHRLINELTGGIAGGVLTWRVYDGGERVEVRDGSGAMIFDGTARMLR